MANGIVVESVASVDAAQKSEIHAGDVLLRWRAGNAKGRFDSPFDLPYMLFAAAPGGERGIQGLRRGRRWAWVLASIPRGMRVRPNFCGQFLSTYLQAEASYHSGNLQDAVEKWRSAAQAAHDAGVEWLNAWFLAHAGEALFGAKQIDASDDLYRAAVEAAAGTDPIIRGEVFRQLASQLEAREDLTAAEKYYRDELSEWRSLHSDWLVMTTLNSLGTLLMREGEFADAESSFVQSLSISRKLDPAGLQAAAIYVNLAVISQERGNLGTAQKYYRIALTIGSKRFPHTFYFAEMLTSFGLVAQRLGDLALAEASHKKALALVQALKVPSLVADILGDLSECRLDRGDLKGAEAYQKRALIIRRESGSPYELAESLSGLGRIYRLERRLGTAGDYYRKALKATNNINPPPPQRATSLAGLGDVFRDGGSYPEAQQHYEWALQLMDQLGSSTYERVDTLASLAATLEAEGLLPQSAEKYREALHSVEYERGTLGPAIESAARYRAIRRRYYRQYIDLLMESGQPALAFEALESSRARSLFDMLSQGRVKIREGVDRALLQRAAVVQQELTAKSQYRIESITGTHNDVQLSRVDRELTELRQQYQELEEKIESDSPNYAALIKPQPLNVTGIQKLLDSETVLLEYSLGEKCAYVWIVGKSTFESHCLPNRSTLESLSRRFYANVTAREKGATAFPQPSYRANSDVVVQKLAARLSDILLRPVAGLIEGKRLLIVSDGALHYLPFSALPEPGKGNQPLVLYHEIVNLPSASVLGQIRRTRAEHPISLERVAVFADPVFNRNDGRVENRSRRSIPKGATPIFARGRGRSARSIGSRSTAGSYLQRLIYTRLEANAILVAVPRGRVLEALGFEANRATALDPKLGGFRIIHFATHTFLDIRHPEFSGLVLSLVAPDGSPQDGLLTLDDIFNLKLSADLVVLSGCETALGEQIDGEELIGLTRGFMYAGASRVVASLWSVSDLATSKLMARFYWGMEQKKMTPPAALRAAQIWMWNQHQWRSPYYWASFQIQGEWN